MNRRKFLTMSVITALALPMGAWATDYRKTNPDTWTAHTVDDAVKALYGDIEFIDNADIKLKLPKIASNGGAVPVAISSNIEAKTVSLFQNSNPESAVAVWTVPYGGIIDYASKVKLKGGADKSSVLTVILEGKDGKFYRVSKRVEVATTSCEGS